MKKIIRSNYGVWVLLTLLLLMNGLASLWHFKWDLTAEKRYTLSDRTRELIQGLGDKVKITVFLDGEMPAGFKKLSNSTREILEQFKEENTLDLEYYFTRPVEDSTMGYTIDSLMRMGLRPTNVKVQAKEGEGEEQRYLFPGALVTYKDRRIPIDFLQGQDFEGGISSLNKAEALLEYKLASAIQKITTENVPLIGYLLGNGETQTYNVFDFIEGTLKKNYRFSFLPIDSVNAIPEAFDAVVVVKPTLPFNDQQKLKLDQYVMNGGKIVWMIDKLYAEMDSLMRRQSDFVAFDRNLNLDDLLFKYGIRINADLVQDLQCDQMPLVVGQMGDKPQVELANWPYFPVLASYTDHPISKNMSQVLSLFPQSIDTVKSDTKKTVLLASSENSRSLITPALVSLNSVKTEEDLKTFNRSHLPVAVLLEGSFHSLYANRFTSARLDSIKSFTGKEFRSVTLRDNRMIVVSDADIVTNVFSQKEGPSEMGYNIFSRAHYANKEFILNCLEYLVNPSGILETRQKDFALRTFDPKQVEQEKTFWQVLNLGLPLLVLLIFGLVFQYLRKFKYSSK